MTNQTNCTNEIRTGWCIGEYDGFVCWPSTPPNQTVTVECPKTDFSVIGESAYRFCTSTGAWHLFMPNKTTNYDDCVANKKYLKMCTELGDGVCQQIGHATQLIQYIGYSVSLVTVTLTLWIFFTYRTLNNNRIRIHKNFFIAILLNIIFRLLTLPLQDTFIHFWTESLTTLYEFAKTAKYMWMFIEGLYLHNILVITVTVFKEHLFMKFYYIVGWIGSIIISIIWIAVMIYHSNIKGYVQTWKYYYYHPYFWILDGPRFFVISINILFLLKIIYILIMKLRQSHTNEIERIVKAVRAAVFLVPLLGIPQLLYLLYLNPDGIFDKPWKLAMNMYVVSILDSFQGCFVSILYCFLNGEVRQAVRNSFYLHMSLRNYDYATCKTIQIVSTLPTTEESNNDNNKNKWLDCCKQFPDSPEEKEINICDLNDHNDTVIDGVKITETKLLSANSSSDNNPQENSVLVGI